MTELFVPSSQLVGSMPIYRREVGRMKHRKHGSRKDRREGRTLYFAYGSNLHVPQMKRRCPGAREEGKASLGNWQLVFRGVADIERRNGAVVHGALWSVTPRDLVALDAYEGVSSGLYYRRVVTVLHKGRPVQALVYIMRDQADRSLPSRSYLQTCATGYSIWGLPSWHLKAAVREAGKWLRDNGMDLDVMYEVGKRAYTQEQMDARNAPLEDEEPVCTFCGSRDHPTLWHERNLYYSEGEQTWLDPARMTKATRLELGIPDAPKGRRLA